MHVTSIKTVYVVLLASLLLQAAFGEVVTALNASQIGNDVFFLFGGGSELQSSISLKFDRRSGSWAPVQNMSSPRSSASAAVLDGEVYVVGGSFHEVDPDLASMESFNPLTGKWTPRPSRNIGADACSSAVLDGILYVAGGDASPGIYFNPTSAVERYDPIQQKWLFVANLSSPRVAATMVAFQGSLLRMGGAMNGAELDIIEQYDPKHDSGSLLATRLPHVATGMEAVV